MEGSSLFGSNKVYYIFFINVSPVALPHTNLGYVSKDEVNAGFV